MEMQLVSGTIEDLKIRTEKVSLVYGPDFQNVASTSAILMALSGLSGAAAQTVNNSDAAFDDVEIYDFRMDDRRYSGICRKFSAKAGDRVDLVVRTGDPLNVLAVRRPLTRSIWTFPYMTKGHKAAVVHGFQNYLVACAAMIPLGFLATMLMILFDSSGAKFYLLYMLPIMTLGSFVILPPFAIWIGPRFYRMSLVATSIFRTLGFDKPEWVSLQKSTRAYIKTHGAPKEDFRRDELRY